MATVIVSQRQIWTYPSRDIYVEYETQNRTQTSVQVRYTIKYIMNGSSGYEGYSQYFTPTINGSAQSAYQIKENTPTNWYNNPIIKTTGWYTISGISSSTTSVSTTMLFTSADPDDSNVSYTGTISFSAWVNPVPTTPTSLSVTPNYSRGTSYYYGYDAGIILIASGSQQVSQYVYQVKVDNGAWTTLDRSAYVPPTTTSYGSTFTFRVRADNPSGSSGYYQSSTIITYKNGSPNDPTNVLASTTLGGYGDTIRFTWSGSDTNAAPISSYNYSIKYGSGSWSTFTTTTNTYADITLDGNGGQSVQLKVKSFSDTTSLYSAEVTSSNSATITGVMKEKVSGSWRTGTAWIKVNGTWKRAKRVWVKVNGTWRGDDPT